MASRDRTHTRSLLVISEIACSLVLLAGAGLMIASLAKLLRVNLGFDSKNVVTMKLSLPRSRYSLGQGAALYQQLQDEVRHLPGVQAVAIVNQIPTSDVVANASFDVEGTGSKNDINVADTQIISRDYFRVMGISLIEGRPFNEQDANLPPSSVVVNQVFARKVWPGGEALGKRIRLRSDAPWLSVIGVVANIKNHGSYVPTKPEMYFVYTDKPFGVWADLLSMTLVVRTALAPEQIVGPIRGQLRHLDPDLPMYDISSLEQIVSSSVSPTRYPAFAFSLFACGALMLAVIGAYGVLAYTVAQRRHEIGLRMALGARRSQVLRFFLAQGVRWAAAGGLLGLIAALLLVRFMRSILFDVKAYDPTIFLAACAVLSIAVLLACVIPALQATKIDPMIVLRSE